MAQQLKALATLAEDPGLVPRTHLGCLMPATTPAAGELMFLASAGPGIHMHVPTRDIHTHTHTHTKLRNKYIKRTSH